MPQTIFDFEIENLFGEVVNFADFKGKVLLIVNTASFCGFTPQYEGLEALYQKYKSQGLIIVAFPCNQFGEQEPDEAGAIGQFCQKNYGVSFPVMGKVEVNGKEAHPIFKYLKSCQKGFLGSRIKWNFTKFLCDKEGKPVKRYSPMTKPCSLEKSIKKLLM